MGRMVMGRCSVVCGTILVMLSSCVHSTSQTSVGVSEASADWQRAYEFIGEYCGEDPVADAPGIICEVDPHVCVNVKVIRVLSGRPPAKEGKALNIYLNDWYIFQSTRPGPLKGHLFRIAVDEHTAHPAFGILHVAVPQGESEEADGAGANEELPR